MSPDSFAIHQIPKFGSRQTQEVARQLINTPKVMVTVFWNASGLYVNRFLEGCTSLNCMYFTEHVFSEMECLPTPQKELQQKKFFSFIWTIHRFTSHVRLLRKLRPCVSPWHPIPHTRQIWHRLASFSLMPKKMVGIDFESSQELINWIRSTLEAIPSQVLNEVFESWPRRAPDCVNSKDHISKHSKFSRFMGLKTKAQSWHANPLWNAQIARYRV
jgi:hypothetical protein